MSKFYVRLSVEAKDASEAKKIGELLQNITDRTDNETKEFLYNRVRTNPDYFKNIAAKLKNPMIQKFLG